MENKIVSKLVTCGYWRRNHSFNPLDGLLRIIYAFSYIPERVAKAGENLIISENDCTIEYINRIDQVPFWMDNIAQTAFLNMAFIPNQQQISWKIDFMTLQPLHRGKKSMFIGLTNNTSWGNTAPNDPSIDWNQNDVYIGYEISPHSFLCTECFGSKKCHRNFDVRPFTVFKRRSSSVGRTYWRWNIGEKNIINLTTVCDQTRDDVKKICYKPIDRIFGELLFSLTKINKRGVYQMDISISHFPQQMKYNENEKHSQVIHVQQDIKDIGLAITIPHGACMSVIKYFFGDAYINHRFKKG